MAFGKAIFGKALDLGKALLGKGQIIAIAHHAGDELLAELGNPAGAPPGRHGAAQLIGLAR
ncbi:hypothetical protein D3C87_1973920 [compost metagenome]